MIPQPQFVTLYVRPIVDNMRAFITALLALSIGASTTPSRRGDSGLPKAHVKNGTYEGVYSPWYHQDFFLGVPFAQPPLDNLRFQLPQSLNTTWEGSRGAKDYSLLCVGYGVSSAKGKEDFQLMLMFIYSSTKLSTTNPRTVSI